MHTHTHTTRKRYAKFCKQVKDHLPEFTIEPTQEGEGKVRKVTFKRCLINRCQEEFVRTDRYDEAHDEETAQLDAAAKASKTRKVRLRSFGTQTPPHPHSLNPKPCALTRTRDPRCACGCSATSSSSASSSPRRCSTRRSSRSASSAYSPAPTKTPSSACASSW